MKKSIGQVKMPATKVMWRMIIWRTMNYFGSDAGINGLSKGGVFDNSRRFARIIVETFTLARQLHTAFVHKKVDASFGFIGKTLLVDGAIKPIFHGRF